MRCGITPEVGHRFKSKISKKLHEAIFPIIERLELNGDISGNGYHLTQKIVEYAAQQLLEERQNTNANCNN